MIVSYTAKSAIKKLINVKKTGNFPLTKINAIIYIYFFKEVPI